MLAAPAQMGIPARSRASVANWPDIPRVVRWFDTP